MIYSFLRPYRKALGVAVALMLIELGVELVLPLFIARVINEGIHPQDMSAVAFWGGWMLALALISFASGIINSFFAAHVSQHFGYDLRQRLFERVQAFSFARFNFFPTSTLITRVTSDVNQLQNVVFMGMRIMLRAPLLIVGSLVMALTVNLKLGMLLTAVTPVLVILLVWIMNKGFALFRNVQERLDQVNGVIRENLLGMRLIRVFVRGSYETKRFARTNEDLQARTIAALRLVELTIPILLFLMNICVLLVLWYGRIEVSVGGVSTGEVAAIVIYATRITGALSVVSMVMMNVSRAKASVERISNVLDGPDAEEELTSEAAQHTFRLSEGTLQFENVSFTYPDTHRKVLQGISLQVGAGQTVAVMGATGSGKTSLFQLIPRLYELDQGRIMIDGVDIHSIEAVGLREQIGFVPQESVLFSGTILENLRWGKPDATMEEIVEATSAAQIHATIMRFPKQYETMLGQKGINLSGGQKQRLSIARALVRRSKLLLLDDSTSALDSNTEARLLAALRSVQSTTLLITQKVSTAMQADHIILLDEGRVLAQGNHHLLLQSCPLYKQIVDSQLGEGVMRHG